MNFIKDPAPQTTPPDGSVIGTDQHNEIVDRLGAARPAPNMVILSDAAGLYVPSTVDKTHLQFLLNVTSDIQAQIDSKPTLDGTGRVSSSNLPATLIYSNTSNVITGGFQVSDAGFAIFSSTDQTKAIVWDVSGGAGTGSTGEIRSLVSANQTRIWNFPDKSGTVAMLSDVPTLPISESNVINLVTDLAGKVGTGDSRLSDKRAPTITSETLNDIMYFNGTNWVRLATASGFLKGGSTPAYSAIAESDVTNLVSDLAGKQPLDSDLTTIAGLTPTNNDFMQYKSGAWANRSPTQAKVDLAIVESDVANLPGDLAAKAGLTRISGASGAAGPDITIQVLSSNDAGQSSTTPAAVMTTTGVGVGTWKFRYTIIYRSAATTTGIKMAVNHTGTTTKYIMNAYYLTTGGTAATGIASGIQASQTAGLMEGKAERVLNTVSSATAGVDTANADIMTFIEGIVVVSVSGNLQLMIGTEVAASAITVQANSMLELIKVA